MFERISCNANQNLHAFNLQLCVATATADSNIGVTCKHIPFHLGTDICKVALRLRITNARNSIASLAQVKANPMLQEVNIVGFPISTRVADFIAFRLLENRLNSNSNVHSLLIRSGMTSLG